MATHSQQFLRQRQMLLLAPLVMVPFIVLTFWSLDGGKASAKANDAKVAEQRGINTNMPAANLTANEPTDKMSLYAQAKKDSLDKRINTPVTDTNNLQKIGQTTASKYGQGPVVNNTGLNPSPVQPRGYKDPNEEKVKRKLNELYQQMGQTGNVNPGVGSSNMAIPNGDDEETNKQLAQIHQSMKELSADKGADDPEMQQLNGMLDKIMDVQNPQRVRERLREKSLLNKEAVYPVSASNDEGHVSIIRQTSYNQASGKYQNSPKVPAGMPGSYKPKYQNRPAYSVTGPQVKRNSFYGLGNANNSLSAEPNAIGAVVHQNQTLVTGATVKLRLLSDIYVNGVRISKNNFIFGVASINGERLNISINSVRFQNSLFPVSLSAFDLDGLSGIYIPGAIERDASKDAAAQGLQGVDYSTLDPSITAQAASAAVTGAKGLLSKKIRLVKVNIKANYRVLLLDGNQGK